MKSDFLGHSYFQLIFIHFTQSKFSFVNDLHEDFFVQFPVLKTILVLCFTKLFTDDPRSCSFLNRSHVKVA